MTVDINHNNNNRLYSLFCCTNRTLMLLEHCAWCKLVFTVLLIILNLWIAISVGVMCYLHVSVYSLQKI